MNALDYAKTSEMIERRLKLEKMADDVGGKVMTDNGRTIIHINAFTHMTEDGTVIHEWP